MATKQTRHLQYFAAVWCLTNKWWSWPAWFSFRCEPPKKSNQSSLRERKTTVPEWRPLPTIYKLLTSVTSFWLFLFSQSKAKYHVYTIAYTVTYHTLWFTKTGTGWLLLLLESRDFDQVGHETRWINNCCKRRGRRESGVHSPSKCRPEKSGEWGWPRYALQHSQLLPLSNPKVPGSSGLRPFLHSGRARHLQSDNLEDTLIFKRLN